MTRKNEGNERRYRHRLNSEWPACVEQHKEAKYKVHLACGHSAHFPFPLPRPGDVLHCVTCGDEPRRVVAAPNHEDR